LPDLLVAFALIAVVLIVSALASGIVERGPLSFPIIFLGIGVILGQRGFGVLAVSIHDQTLEVLAIVS
jgi:NhaP-type Na+/H+ or K+/H+ antiporter